VLPLGEGTLVKNLGIPLVIACNKSDVLPALEKNHEYQDSDFEFIQQHLRTIALKYGATLLYTSTKTGKGCEVLAEYVAHRLLDTAFTTRAQVLDKDTIFVPSGYDSLERITVLNDHTKTGSYEEVIAAPTKKARASREEEVVEAEDDQGFLEKHKGALEKAGKGDRPVRAAVAPAELATGGAEAGATSTPTAASAPGAKGASPHASSLTPGSSEMLQSFFESLMKSESNEGLRKGVEDVIADEKRKSGN
jgi:dynein light intermediate chain 1